MKTLIGHYIIPEQIEVDQPQEHAAWHRSITVQPGEYPVYECWYQGYTYYSIPLNGIICSNYFGAHHLNDEVGNAQTVILQMRHYEIAQLAVDGKIRLLDGVSTEVSSTYEHNGEVRSLYKIVKLSEVAA